MSEPAIPISKVWNSSVP